MIKELGFEFVANALFELKFEPKKDPENIKKESVRFPALGLLVAGPAPLFLCSEKSPIENIEIVFLKKLSKIELTAYIPPTIAHTLTR